MDRNLLVLIQNYKETKDEQYFEAILTKFKPLLNYYTNKLFYLEHDDCFQKLSIALYEAISDMKIYDKESSCISYIEKAVINRFTKLYHKSKKNQQICSTHISIDADSNLTKAFSHEDGCIANVDLQNTLKSKPPLEQRILAMVTLGYSDKEIGISLGYTPQYINRIKKKIIK